MVRVPPRTTSRRHKPHAGLSRTHPLFTWRPYPRAATRPLAPPRHLQCFLSTYDFVTASPGLLQGFSGGGVVIDETTGRLITLPADLQLKDISQWGVAGGPTDMAITHRERAKYVAG